MNAPRLPMGWVLLLTAISELGAAPNVSDSPPRQEYAGFQIITERNIFNSNRSRGSRGGGEETKASHIDTFTLVGTMTYEKGPYAFFDGSSSEYRKVLEPGKAIAQYTVASISGSGVRLEAGTNTVELTVGMQMKREEEGEWKVAGGSRASAANTAGLSTAAKSAGDSSGEEDELVKRLMQQREQELK